MMTKAKRKLLQPIQSGHPTVGDCLKAISDKLTNVKSVAALDHYPSLRVKTRILNDCLRTSSEKVRKVCDRVAGLLSNDAAVRANSRRDSNPLFHYRKIVPQMFQNFHAVVDKLHAATLPAPTLRFEDRGKVEVGFRHFSDLCTSVRQFIDILVQDSFQLLVCDPRELAYEILNSLLTFVIVAPESLQAPIVSDDLQQVVQAFARLSGGKRKNSPFTKADCPTFVGKAEFLKKRLKPSYHRNVVGNTIAIFKFCSDFAHVGYVSTLITAHERGGVYMGGPEDVFLPRAENLAKLKQQLLRECVIFYADIYIRALQRFVGTFIVDAEKTSLIRELESIKDELIKAADQTNIIAKIQPITVGLVGGGKPIMFECSCGAHIEWKPPHHQWDNFCDTCGSRFEMTEVSPKACYAISAQGVGDVVGSVAVPLSSLDSERRKKLNEMWRRNKSRLKSNQSHMEFLFVGNIDAADENGRDTSGKLLRVPPKGSWDIGAFVAETALRSGGDVRIECNCGNTLAFTQPFDDEVLACPCGTHIGIFIVSGDLGYMRGKDPRRGDWKLFPVFGSIFKPVKVLSAAEYKALMADS